MIYMDIITEVKRFVENECKKPSSKYGYGPFLYHFTPVVDYAGELANQLGGDKEVILIAAWLHDIGSIIHGREDHHLTGPVIAEAKLIELGYPTEKIELVKKCISNHRGSQQSHRESIEEKILAEADILSTFESIAGIFKAAFVYEHLDQEEAKESVRRKFENKFKQLHFETSKKIIQPKYEAAMLLLK